MVKEGEGQAVLEKEITGTSAQTLKQTGRLGTPLQRERGGLGGVGRLADTLLHPWSWMEANVRQSGKLSGHQITPSRVEN